MYVLSKCIAMGSHLCPFPLLVNYLKWMLSFRYSTLPSLTYDIFSTSSLSKTMLSIYHLFFPLKNYFIYLLYVCFCLCVGMCVPVGFLSFCHRYQESNSGHQTRWKLLLALAFYLFVWLKMTF